MRTLRIFISSPSDVAVEREKARQVIADLQRLYEGQASLIPVLWEDLAIPATASFQEGIDYFLSERQRIEIAVFILWSRLGSPLGEKIRKHDGSLYQSGTEREFDVMLGLFERSGGEFPIILAYTRNDDTEWRKNLVSPEKKETDNKASSTTNVLLERVNQRELVDKFIRENFQTKEGHNIRAYLSYSEPVAFARRLHGHLREAIDKILEIDSTAVTWLESPYRSLEVFNVEHSPIFCGRDEETCEVLQRMRDQERRGCAFVCIVGASGSGKSSLARAGVAATLLQRAFDEVKQWSVGIMLPSLGGGQILSTLADTIATSVPEMLEGQGGVQRFAKLLEQQNFEAASIILESAFARQRSKFGGGVRLLLIVDQLEELWTDRNISSEQRDKFLKTIECLAQTRLVSVLATLRSDFYPQAQMSEVFLRMKAECGHFDLVQPSPSALWKIIVKPAQRAGLHFECDDRTGVTLDQQMLEDAARDPSSLPLLQYALAELYHRRNKDKRMLLFAEYEKMGGVDGALAQRAAEIFDQLPLDAQAALADLLPQLVSVDIEGEQNPVRRRSPLVNLTRTPGQRLCAERLVEARFLTTDEQNGIAIVTLAHEALLRKWDRITTWIHANRDLLRMRAQLEQGHQRWLKSTRSSSLLLTEGLPLDEGRRLLLEAPHLLNDETAEYVRLSIAGHLSEALHTARNLEDVSKLIEEKHFDVWLDVVRQALHSDIVAKRRNTALLQGSCASFKFGDELVGILLQDTDDSVRQAAAKALVLRGDQRHYDQIRDFGAKPRAQKLEPKARQALACLLAASDMQPQQSAFATWFKLQQANIARRLRWSSWWLRAKSALPTFLFVLIPAATFAVAGAASVKWLPSAFNYSCVQATASAMMGLFHSAPSGIILGGSIAFGLTFYRMVFGREHDRTSMLKPWPAIVFGAVSGLLGGIACVVMIAFVYHPQALEQMGWTSQSVRPPALDLLGDLFLKNHCGLAFPLTSVGLGIGLALMTNSLRASTAWPLFVDQQKPLASLRQVLQVITGIIRVTLRFAAPVPVFVALGAALALLAMSHGANSSQLPTKSLRTILLGGLDDPEPHSIAANKAQKDAFLKTQIAKRINWKTSLEGRCLGLFGDCLAKIVGGYFSIVGMGLGIVALRKGITIEAKRV